VLALDGLVTVIVAAIAVVAAEQGEEVWFSVLVVVAIVGFVGTSAIARLIESRGA
jgi:multisubunit Na+/H+ antiporter MnhF subunit